MIEGEKILQIGWALVVEGFESQEKDLVRNPVIDGEPVEICKEW